MIGLDTNVLIRYLVEDDDVQVALADQVISSLTDDAPGFVSIVTLVETVWVLGRAYRLPQDEILPLVEGMLRAREFRVQQPDAVRQAVLDARASSADFADALIAALGAAAGCDTTLTFDRRAADLERMSLLTGAGDGP